MKVVLAAVRWSVVALLLTCAHTSYVYGSTLTFEYTTQFSNGVQPGGPAPWLSATFNDATASAGNDVRLTLSTAMLSGGLTGSEFISEVFFSVSTAIDPTQITATLISQTTNTFATFNTGVNAFQADGDGRYDINITFNNAPPSLRFDDNNVIVIDFNLQGGTLLANSFNVLAAPGGGNGPFRTAAHLQGIGPTGSLSTWIAGSQPPNDPPGDDPDNPGVVPEPTSLLLLGTGLAGLYARRRKK